MCWCSTIDAGCIAQHTEWGMKNDESIADWMMVLRSTCVAPIPDRFRTLFHLRHNTITSILDLRDLSCLETWFANWLNCTLFASRRTWWHSWGVVGSVVQKKQCNCGMHMHVTIELRFWRSIMYLTSLRTSENVLPATQFTHVAKWHHNQGVVLTGRQPWWPGKWTWGHRSVRITCRVELQLCVWSIAYPALKKPAR